MKLILFLSSRLGILEYFSRSKIESIEQSIDPIKLNKIKLLQLIEETFSIIPKTKINNEAQTNNNPLPKF